MKRALLVLLIAVAMIGAASAFPASILGKDSLGKMMPNKAVTLVSKDPGTWEITPDAWGKMTFRYEKMVGKDKGTEKVCMLVFNGHGLEPTVLYALVSYSEPWPGTGSIELGTGTADEDGNVHIKADFEKDDLVCNDYGSTVGTGSKVWLVPHGDLTDTNDDGIINGFSAWNPTQYLFEGYLINTGCTP